MFVAKGHSNCSPLLYEQQAASRRCRRRIMTARQRRQCTTPKRKRAEFTRAIGHRRQCCHRMTRTGAMQNPQCSKNSIDSVKSPATIIINMNFFTSLQIGQTSHARARKNRSIAKEGAAKATTLLHTGQVEETCAMMMSCQPVIHEASFCFR